MREEIEYKYNQLNKSMIKIGISGAQGSFSEEAANCYCQKNNITEYELAYLVSVENVLSALNKKEVDLGIFPIENSNGGIVVESVYAMSKHIFEIEKIFEIDVQHCLLAKPKMNISDIKKIASHPQALKQCRMYLKRKWENIELQEYSDTASAANDLDEGILSFDSAVIAPKICADLYKLDILEENIQDLKFNFTAFIAAKK